jgi:hypothetical protein
LDILFPRIVVLALFFPIATPHAGYVHRIYL